MSEEIKNTEKKEETLEEKIARTAKGSMKLIQPIENGSETVEEVRWDFGAVRAIEYAEALDSGLGKNQMFVINNEQMFHFFAIAAEKGTPSITAEDIRSRMMVEDSMQAIGKGVAFFISAKLAHANGDKTFSTKGSMNLLHPIENNGEKVTELFWDFGAITGAEYAAALDYGAGKNSAFSVTNKQMFCIFAVAVEKAMTNVKADIVRNKLLVVDGMEALEKAAGFFFHSRLAHAGNGSKK